MSKKNLARTALEAGRLGSWVRKELNSKERARVRNYLHRVKTDPEYWDEEACPAQPLPGYDDMVPGENLSAVYRWVDSHVGQKWDDVYSKLCKSWPKKTLAGYHIIEDHIKWEVQKTPHPYLGWYRRWYVDDDGVLQRYTYESYASSHRKKEAQYPNGRKYTKEWIANWLGGTLESFRPDSTWWYWKDHYYGRRVRKLGSKYFFVHGAQERQLTKEEVAIWESIYPWVRQHFESPLKGE